MHAPPHTILWVGRISNGMAVTTHIPGTRRITEETVWACPPEKWREGVPHPSDFSTRSGALASPGAVQGPSLVNPGSTLSPRALLVLLALTSKTSFKLMLPLHHTGQRRRAPAHLFDNMVITKWDLAVPPPCTAGHAGRLGGCPPRVRKCRALAATSPGHHAVCTGAWKYVSTPAPPPPRSPHPPPLQPDGWSCCLQFQRGIRLEIPPPPIFKQKAHCDFTRSP